MNDILQSVCEEFITNRDMLKDTFKSEGMVPHLVGAALLLNMSGEPDTDRLRECERILKKHEGIFSPFRGVLKLPVLINMSAADDPELYLRMVRRAYDLICRRKGRRDERYYVPAMAIASVAYTEEEIEEAADSTGALIDDERSIDDLLAEAGMTEDEINAGVADADGFLKGQKGFGLMGVGADMRKMFAKMLVCIACERAANDATHVDLKGRADPASVTDKTSYEHIAEAALDKAIESRYRAMQEVQSHSMMSLQTSMLLSMQILMQTQIGQTSRNTQDNTF